ncbi:MAG: endo alpha-1,4 polygalactosaminidase [Balneola sp.]
MSKIITLIFTCLMVINCTSSTDIISLDTPIYDPFGVVYSDIDPLTIDGYKTVIVEPNFFDEKDIEVLHDKGIKVIAYLSLGEVNPSRKYFEDFKEVGFKGENGNHGSFYIDLTSDVIKDSFIEQIIPERLAKGFDGLFLDTIDAVAPYTDRSEMEADMVELIKRIKISFSDKLLIQNAGLFLLDKTHEYIDGIGIEDIASGYNFDTNEYKIKSEEAFQERLVLVDETYQRYKIPFLIIDFANDDSSKVIVKSRLENTGHAFFISNIEFNGLPSLNYTYQKMKKGA